MRTSHSLLVILFFLASVPTLVWGNERKFGYTYETSVLPIGAREIELWNTFRNDRGYFYRRMDQRIEYEFGVGSNLMSALYLNYSWRLEDANGSAPGGSAVASSSLSISNEWKYKILDRVADPVGLGLYGEVTLGLDEFEFEGKLLVDKQIGKWLLAFNAVAENEWETEFTAGETETSSEVVAEFDLGIAYAPHPQWSLGLEVRNHNEIVKGDWEHSALFAGPVVSYSAESWWATLTVLPQITSIRGATSGNLVLVGHEKLEARLLFSFHL